MKHKVVLASCILVMLVCGIWGASTIILKVSLKIYF